MITLTNGKIWTGAAFARSLTIEGDRIVALDDAPQGRVVDLGGRLVVPGFIDNHVHFVTGCLQQSRVQLRGAASIDEFARRVGDYAAKLEEAQWVVGTGWDEQMWSPRRLPVRSDIDALTPRNPVFVTRADIHMGLANSVALARAGITRETPDPPGGTIVRGPDGEATGLLKDAAMQLVQTQIPPPSLDERVAAIRVGLAEAARCGVTAFCDMGMAPDAYDDLRAYERLDRDGELTTRVFMYLPIDSWERLASAGIERGFGSPRVRIAGLKGFSDGSLGSSTAAMNEPYEDEPQNRGLLMAPMLDGSMQRWLDGADAAELQVTIHAIGDRAAAEVLSLFESRPEHRSRRFRIEHAQHLTPDLYPRFAAARVTASMQPFHAIDDGRWAETKIGNRRGAWAARSLLDAGAHVTFGSDWPVAPLDPMSGIHSAVTRRTIDGKHPGGWIPEEKITVAEALRCYTANNAFAVFGERELGSIAPGMRADLAVLSHDLFTIAPEEIERVRVEMTIFDGRIIHQ